MRELHLQLAEFLPICVDWDRRRSLMNAAHRLARQGFPNEIWLIPVVCSLEFFPHRSHPLQRGASCSRTPKASLGPWFLVGSLPRSGPFR